MKIVIIGGAGFIGINCAYYFIEKGHQVTIIDNLSRVGSAYNLQQIQLLHNTPFFNVDIRNYAILQSTLESIGEINGVLLLAGQVAVTNSVLNPREDFEINALGTFNVLEAIRNSNQNPLLIYSSTNKVYGKMENFGIQLKNGRYEYKNLQQGVSEDLQLDFFSPYGCSKGTGDQYVRDYARIYGMHTVVMRQSCIYGNNQFGIEDQGWVAWFTIATLLNKQIYIYGDGNQIRDVLFVSDLVRLYEIAFQKKEICKGQIYNVGGSINNTLSLNELIAILSNKFNKVITPIFKDWRPGDQKVFISNINKVSKELGWQPEVKITDGINKMADWIETNAAILNQYVFNNK